MEHYLGLLGYQVKDAVTGYEGVVDSVAFDLYGCVQVAVTPPANKKDPEKTTSGRWFDHKRLTVLSKKPVMPPPSFAKPAGTEQGPADKPAR